jgi:TetR/AcrR family transcriptional repressor of mexCD-oprJ operon
MARELPSLRDRTASAILEAAARVLARTGTAATMGDVAVEARLGRATLYRYFENREQLVSALWDVALGDAAKRLAAARLEQVSVEEGVARAVRAIAAVGERYEVLLRDPSAEQRERAAAAIGEPIRRLVERGQREGVLRADVSAAMLGEMLGGLILAGLVHAFGEGLGAEEASAIIANQFLQGALR